MRSGQCSMALRTENFYNLMRSVQNPGIQLAQPSWRSLWDMGKKEIRRCLNRFRYRVKKIAKSCNWRASVGQTSLGTYRDLKDAEIDLLFPKQIS